MNLKEEYCRLSFELQRIYEKYASSLGFSIHTLVVIRTIVENNNCTQTKIYESNILSKQTVNSIIKELVAKKFIVLEVSIEDKRKKIVTLTREGINKLIPIIEKLKKSEDVAFNLISKDNQKIIVDNYRLFNKNLEKELLEGENG